MNYEITKFNLQKVLERVSVVTLDSRTLEDFQNNKYQSAMIAFTSNFVRMARKYQF